MSRSGISKITLRGGHLAGRFQLITGPNGSGKTNLLDAIYYLGLCRSYFTRSDASVLYTGSDWFRLDGLLAEEGEEVLITCKYRPGTKEFLKNEIPYEKLSDHIGFIPVVMIAPDDTDIIRGGSELRRRFLDAAIAQSDPEYLRQLMTYNKVLAQRNALLKSAGDQAVLSILNAQLSGPGDHIHATRKKYLEQFTPICSGLYAQISGGKEVPSIAYSSGLEEADMTALLKKHAFADREAGRSTAGIHRDDLQFQLDVKALKEFGSQGQVKSFLIALKLAQFQLMAQNGMRKPILLLDDIFEKLDAARLDILFSILRTEDFGQVFITDADPDRSDGFLKNARLEHAVYDVRELLR
ncbi:MAG: DNA replication and repair protein RecF [Chitinophagales bacterium]